MERKQYNVDWDKIRNEYIGSSISSNGLAKRYGVPESTLRKRRTEEDWDKEREETREALRRVRIAAIAKAQEKVEEDIANEATETLKLLVAKLSEAAKLTSPNDIRSMRDITQTLQTIHDLGLYEVKQEDAGIEVSFKAGGSDYAD